MGTGGFAKSSALRGEKSSSRTKFRRPRIVPDPLGLRTGEAMSLDEMVDLCRKCHRLGPFTNYNGNTFAALARSLAGHIVAGVASDEEVRAFRAFCEALG